MLARIRPVLDVQCRLARNRPVLVGVSGGPDSLCLLDLLNRLGYPVVVAHFNHGLRAEADADAEAVRQVANSLGLPFVLGKTAAAEFAAERSLSLEEAGRTLRYQFLFEQARLNGAQAVAVGHTADDQVETVLMHLLRGAGLAGLKGMTVRALPTNWSSEIPLIRPLLAVWRKEVEAYGVERGLKPLMDSTNLDTRFFRNRLRSELIPYLESYNPAARQLIWRTARVLAADFEWVEGAVQAAWGEVITDFGAGFVSLDTRALAAQPLGLQRHLIRRAVALLRPGLRDVDYDCVEQVLAFSATPTLTRQRDLAAGLRLLAEGDRLWLATWEADLPAGEWPQFPWDEPCLLDIPGGVELLGGWRLRSEWVLDIGVARTAAQENPNPYQAWVACDDLQLPLVIRGRRMGERFHPLGMAGHSLKLSEFMINVKMPHRARDAWPLVCGFREKSAGSTGAQGGEVIWVPGFRLGHAFRLTDETDRAAFLRLERI